VVTNTNSAVNGTQTATATSEAVIIDVAATYYTIAFYDSNLDLLESFNGLPTGHRVDLDSNATKHGVIDWYLKGASEPVTSFSVFNSDVNFYALPNVKEITTQVELADIGANATTLSGNYILLNDIELTTGDGFDAYYGWSPIGSNSTNNADSRFSGVFNGNNHKITNLWINKPAADYVGLFGYIDGGAIRNLGIEIADGKEVRGNDNVGGIAGYSNSTIANSYVIGNVSGEVGVGGIAGSSYLIIDSYATGDVNGRNAVGGIVGYSNLIIDSYATGNVSATGYYVGGIAGSSGSITNSYATGNVSATGDYVGGIVGHVITDISNSYARGNVSATGDNVGGIAGYIYSGSITNSYATGDVSATGDNVGGIAGSSGSITNSYATGNVSATGDNVGGIAGYSGSITNSYATGDVNGTNYVGGIAGNVITDISNSYATGDVNGTNYVGGIAGSSGSITNSYATGNVSATGDYVGGIVGYLYDGSISNSYATGDVSGTGSVGGIAGSSGSITNSYATGNVSATGDYVGGIVGYLYDGSISNSYATGYVNGSDYVGGIVGYISGSALIRNNAAINPSVTRTGSSGNRVVGGVAGGTVTNNFALDIMSGSFSFNGVAGTSKTIDELKTQSTYSASISGDGAGGLGWLFGSSDASPWKHDASKNDGYPYLYWETR
jgi:hypothetical protein